MEFTPESIGNQWSQAKTNITNMLNIANERAYIRMYDIKNWAYGVGIYIEDFDINKDIIAIEHNFKNIGSSYVEYNTYYKFLHKNNISEIIDVNYYNNDITLKESIGYTATLTDSDDGGAVISRSDLQINGKSVTVDAKMFLIRTDGIYEIDGTTGDIITEEG